MKDDKENPHRESNISLREITEHNWRTVANLKLLPEQAGNLASNAMSMLEAHYSEDAWMRAVYADGTIVGFLMLAIWPPNNGYYIWRFMIDHRYQSLGFGHKVARMAIQHITDNYPNAKKVGVCSSPREGRPGKVEAKWSPYRFWEKQGFKQVADPDEDGDVLMMMDM